MSYTFKWVIVDVQVALKHEGINDVVTAVNWRYEGTNGMCITSVHGLTELDPIDPNDYIPFDRLTSQQVIDWLISKLGPAAIEGFENQIISDCEVHNFTIVTKTLPN